MRKTIKQLEGQLQIMQADRDNFYTKWYALKEADDKRVQNERFAMKIENTELNNQIRNLMEIVRWHIRPATADSPFRAMKEQRDPEERIGRSY